MNEAILVTGGAGFIGSHTCLTLLEAGHRLVVLDNFINSNPNCMDRVAELAGLETVDHRDRLVVVSGDVRSQADLERCFVHEGPIKGVIHFAGLKAVGESVAKPLLYWDVNVNGTLQLLQAMQRHGCRSIVFSSSCTVYGNPMQVPIRETTPVDPINPYGFTKAGVERILQQLSTSEPDCWRVGILRYFNPVGAHPSGNLGEDPCGFPNNLFPFLLQVAIGRRPELSIFGSDWPTPDGTCIRDYIHVMDLAEGHRAALDALQSAKPQVITLNLGTGQGYSVLEVLHTLETVVGIDIPHRFVERRSGDAAITVSDPSLAAERIYWKAQRDLSCMCRDAWEWQRRHPDGFASI